VSRGPVREHLQGHRKSGRGRGEDRGGRAEERAGTAPLQRNRRATDRRPTAREVSPGPHNAKDARRKSRHPARQELNAARHSSGRDPPHHHGSTEVASPTGRGDSNPHGRSAPPTGILPDRRTEETPQARWRFFAQQVSELVKEEAHRAQETQIRLARLAQEISRAWAQA
jgi:hypothetical protein